jgi:hypothetical protein
MWSDIGVSDIVNLSFVGSVGLMQRIADGWTVDVTDARVTAVFDDEVYVEDAGRCSGLRVLITGTSCSEGDSADVSGTVDTWNGARIIRNARIDHHDHKTPLTPLGMSNRTVVSDQPLTTPSGSNANGLITRALLVKTCGTVTHSEDDFFYIDDGSHVQDDSPYVGLKVVTNGLVRPTEQHFVFVTGISMIENSGEVYRRVVRIRKPADVWFPAD